MESKLQKEAKAASALKEALRAAFVDDPQMIADMVEGETDFLEQMAYACTKFGEAKAMESGIDAYIKKLQERKKRFQRAQTSARLGILDAMILADEKSVKTPPATVSRTQQPQQLIITDDTSLPDDCYRIKKEPDAAAIKDKLKRGESITGALLSNGGETITIRMN